MMQGSAFETTELSGPAHPPRLDHLIDSNAIKITKAVVAYLSGKHGMTAKHHLFKQPALNDTRQ